MMTTIIVALVIFFLVVWIGGAIMGTIGEIRSEREAEERARAERNAKVRKINGRLS